MNVVFHLFSGSKIISEAGFSCQFKTMQMSQQEASAVRYWFRGEPNLQFSENMFLLYFQIAEQFKRTKPKLLGDVIWPNFVFFTYWEKQIVDNNCTRFIFQFCVCFAANVVFLSAVSIWWWWWRRLAETWIFRQNALQLIRCLRTVVTEKSPRKRQVTKQGERANKFDPSEFMLNWLA